MIRFLCSVFLALATFSSLAAGRELAPRDLAPTVYSTHLPATAFAGERFLTVWFEQRPLGSVIMGAFSDSAGRRVSAEAFPIVKAPVSYSLQLLGTGDSYTLFWRDGAGRTQMADLDRLGRITRQITLPLPELISARMAWNGRHYLAAMQDPSGLTQSTEAVIFDRDGRIVRSGIALNREAYGFDIAVAGDTFTVVTAGWDGLFAHRVSADGTTAETVIELAHGTSTTAYRARTALAIAKQNGDVLVVWSAAGAGAPDLKSVLIQAGGQLSPIHVAEAAGVEPIHVMADGDGYTLAILVPGQEGRFSVSSIQLRSDGTFGHRSSTSVDVGSWRTAAASKGGVILLTYNPASSIASRVTSVALTSNGSATTPEILAIARARQFQPILGAGGGLFLAAWAQQTGDDTSVRTATVNALGEPANLRTLQERAFLGSPDLAWNGSEYLALTWSGTWLMARRLTFDGTPIDVQPIVLATNTRPASGRPLAAVTWADDRWVVVYPADNAMMFATVSHGGVLTASRRLAIDTPLPVDTERVFHHRPAIAFDGHRLLMVWSEGRATLCFFPPCGSPPDEAFAVRLDKEGNSLDPQPLGLPDEAANEVSIATSGREFLVGVDGRVLVLEGGGASLRITASAPLLDGHGVMDVIWEGTSYVVALRFQKDSRWYLGVKRLDNKGVETEAMRAVVTNPPEFSDAPGIAGASGLGILLGNQETDLVNGTRAMVYREDELQPVPGEIPRPRRRSVR